MIQNNVSNVNKCITLASCEVDVLTTHTTLFLEFKLVFGVAIVYEPGGGALRRRY